MVAETFDLPDGHRTVELRALSRRMGTRTLALPTGVVLANSELEFGGVYGDIAPDLIIAFLDRHEFAGQLLFVAASPPPLPSLRFSRALVFGKIPGAEALAPPLPSGYELRRANPTDDFSGFEDEPMEELYDAVRREPMWVIARGARIQSAAYAAWRSERYADVSVDTIPDARRLGLATHAARALVDTLEQEGLIPVWGAFENNAPSLRLARRLGFNDEKGPVYLAKYPAA